MKIKTALDSNILVYLYDNEHKRKICELLIVDKPTIRLISESQFSMVTISILGE